MTARKRKRRKKKKRQAKARRRRRDVQRKQAPPPVPSPASSPNPPREPQEVAPAEPPEEPELLDIWETGIPKDPDAAIAAFQEALEAGALDAEDSFEWLLQIRDALGDKDPEARARFAALIQQLRQQAPELYRDNIGYFIDVLVSDAIAEGRWDAIPDLVAPFVAVPDEYPEFFAKVRDQLLYHGRIEFVRDAMRQAWPAVQKSAGLLPWAIDEFASQAMLVELFAYLEKAENPRADDPILLEATARYGEWKEGWLEGSIPRLTASAPSPWQRADFGEAVDADRWQENLHALLLEFVADRRRAGVPFSRGYMAHRQLGEFLNWQFSNPTIPGTSGSRRQTRRKGERKRKKGRTQPPGGPPLVPRYPLLDRFVAKLFPFLGAQPYQAAALVELLPAYLHFLARLNLIHPTEMDEALEELRPLVQHLPRVLRDHGADPVAVQNVAAAWAGEALAALRDDPALESARAAPLPETPAPPPVPAPRPGALETYTFKVTYLQDPDVWRTIEIAGNQTLDDLHYAIQNAVNFDADHLYSFYMSGRAWDDTTEYASPFAQGRSAAGVKIRDLGLRMKQRFLYLFDYGDEHRFEVQLLGINPDAPKEKYPRIVERHGPNPRQYGWWDEEDEWEDEDEWNQEDEP